MKIQLNTACAGLAALIVGLCAVAAPASAEKLVAVPLHCTGDIPTAIGRGFTEHLRGLAQARAELVDEAGTEQALATAAASVMCTTEACAMGIAGAAGARFVLSGAVDNTDEIYKVSLRLYDASTKATKTAEGVCELCAAEEVDRTIGAAFAQLQPALAVAPPAPPAAPVPVAIEVVSSPPGADITLGGKPVGRAPIVLRVAPGSHVIGASKAGMKPAERTVQARKETVKLTIRLTADATSAPPVTPPPVTPPPVTVPPPVAATDEDDEEGGYVYTGSGMIIGGVLLTAGGIYATLLDGEVTCTDGLGRRECPTVYNTKGVGMTALGLGAGLIGAGVTLIIVDVLDDGDVAPSAAITPDGAVLGLGGRF